MTLRTKTLLIVGLTLIALFVALYLSLSAILSSGFTTLENQFVTRNVTRAFEALSDDINKMNRNVGDWAPWDDTYQFADDVNEDYIADNLIDSVFYNLGINVMMFVNSSGEIVYDPGFDLINYEFVPASSSLEELVADEGLLTDHAEVESNYAGLLLLPENPMIIASQPILTSNGEGPINGTLIMGRYLDDEFIASLEERTKFVITIERLDTGNLPGDFETAFESLQEQEEGSIHITPLNEERIAGYRLLTDVNGDPALLLRVDMQRDVHAQGESTLQLLIISLAGLGVVFVILTLLIIERLVLARMFQLSEGVAEIGASGDLSQRLTFPGRDEISQLADSINKMLSDLQESLKREKELRAEVQKLRIQIDQSKKAQQVAEITESDYFQNLQQKAKDIRSGKSSESESKEETESKPGED